MNKGERKNITKNYKKEYNRKPVPKFPKKKDKGKCNGSKNDSRRNNVFLYRSSRTVFFYKWFLPLIAIMIVIAGVSELVKTPHLVRDDWRNGAPVVIIWITLLLIILMLRLRKIRVYSEHISIKSLWRSKMVSYSDIEWVSQTILTKIKLVRIKYRNNKGRLKRLITIPAIDIKTKNSILFSEDEMTIYIRKRITDCKPNYDKSVEPKRWGTFTWIISVPVLTIIVAKVWGFEWVFKILF